MDVWAIRITIEKAASNLFKLISPEACFHSRRSQSWIKRYVLTKVKPMESNEMRSHTIQWNWIVGLKAIGWPEYSHCNWFIFHLCLRLRQFSFHWIISFGVMRGSRSKWNRSDSSDSDSGVVKRCHNNLWHRLRLRFSIFILSKALFRLRLWLRLRRQW